VGSAVIKGWILEVAQRSSRPTQKDLFLLLQSVLILHRRSSGSRQGVDRFLQTATRFSREAAKHSALRLLPPIQAAIWCRGECCARGR
jgi:hypothetical protein